MNDLGDCAEEQNIYRRQIAKLRAQNQSKGGQDSPELVQCLSNFSHLLFTRGELTEALTLAIEATKLAEDLADLRSSRESRFAAAVTWNRLSIIFHAIDDDEQATAASLKAASIARDSFNLSNLPDLIDYGLILSNLKNNSRTTDLDLSITVGIESIAIMRKACQLSPIDYIPKLAMVMSEHSSMLHTVNRLREAESYAREAISLLSSFQRDHGIDASITLAFVYSNLSGVLCSQERFEEAIETQQQAIKIHCGGLPYEKVDNPTVGLARALLTMGTIIQSDEANFRRMSAGYFFERSVEVWNWITRKDPRMHMIERALAHHHLAVCIFSEFIFSEHERCYDALTHFRESVVLTQQVLDNFIIRENRDAYKLRSLAHYGGLVQFCVMLWEKNLDYSLLNEAARTIDSWRSRRLLELYFSKAQKITPAEDLPDSHITAASALTAESYSLGSEPVAQSPKRFGTEIEPASHPQQDGDFIVLSAKLDLIELVDTQNILGLKPRIGISQDRLREPWDCIPTDKPTILLMLVVLPMRTVGLMFCHSKEIVPLILPNLAVENCVSASQNWIGSYRDYRMVCQDRYAEDHHKLLAQRNWEEFLLNFIDYLSREIVFPLWNLLLNADDSEAIHTERIMIMPHGPLQSYPLHVCTAIDNQPLCDLVETLLVPNASLVTAIATKPPSKQETLFAVSNPDLNLPFSSWEVAELQSRQPLQMLSGAAATIASAMRALPLAKYFLFSGHAIFHSDNPTQSGLKFSDGILTVEALAENKILENCDLVFLNGCETALLNPSFTDDHVSLPSACLQAGARCVISTLWTVDDIPASLLSYKFHQLWDFGRGQKPGSALNQAIKWLRGQPNAPTSSGRDLLQFFSTELRHSPIDTVSKDRCLEEIHAIAERFPDSPPFCHPVHWGAYVVHGVAW
jgi:CHAT domain-containing protein/tetratricopeptide (TPR) repeat protein